MTAKADLKPIEGSGEPRLTKRPAGLGKLILLCPQCKGSAGDRRVGAIADPCTRCDGKGTIRK